MVFETQLIRSRRRSISLEVKDDASVVIRAPKFVPQNFLDDLLVKKSAWIEKSRTQALRRQQIRSQIDVKACQLKARELIPERVAYYSALYRIKYSRIKINSAKKRWGSCSAKGNLNFSWRLAMVPLEVIDYVVVHELAHIVHRNHSKRFWALVAKLYPNYKACRKWLRHDGHLL
ncbi:MAG: M48 family metallopeptidase [bacterium]